MFQLSWNPETKTQVILQFDWSQTKGEQWMKSCCWTSGPAMLLTPVVTTVHLNHKQSSQSLQSYLSGRRCSGQWWSDPSCLLEAPWTRWPAPLSPPCYTDSDRGAWSCSRPAIAAGWRAAAAPENHPELQPLQGNRAITLWKIFNNCVNWSDEQGQRTHSKLRRLHLSSEAAWHSFSESRHKQPHKSCVWQTASCQRNNTAFV